MSSNGLTLTQVSQIARKAIYGLAIGFFVLAVTTYIMRQVEEYKRLHPPVIKEYPNYLFGKIPKIEFPKEEEPRRKFTLEIASGFFPATPEVVKVYNYKTFKAAGFDPVQSARDFAKKNNFSGGEIKINDEEYAFIDKNNRLKKMIINVVDKTFKIQSDLKTDYSLLTTYNLPSPEEAINFSFRFLQQNGLWTPKDVNNKPQILYYKITPQGELSKTILPYEANLIKVVYSRDKIDNQNTFFPKTDEGIVSFLLAGGKDGNPVIAQMKYAYFEIDEVNFGKYLTRPPNEAWIELLEKKEGYISSQGELGQPIVRSVYLGYYDSLDGKNYLQPVWVFEGDKGFIGFVPAVLPK